MAWREPSETFRTGNPEEGREEKLPTPPSANRDGNQPRASPDRPISMPGSARSRTVTGDLPRSLMQQTRLVDRLGHDSPGRNTTRRGRDRSRSSARAARFSSTAPPPSSNSARHRPLMPRCFSAPPFLSGIRIDGRDMALDTSAGPARRMGGACRPLSPSTDDWAPAAQARLDGNREGPGRALRNGGPRCKASTVRRAGLFTDAGARSDPALEQGLAARLAVND